MLSSAYHAVPTALQHDKPRIELISTLSLTPMTRQAACLAALDTSIVSEVLNSTPTDASACVGLRACRGKPERGQSSGRCPGVSVEMMWSAMVDVGPLLSASFLRSLTLVDWLRDPSFLRQVPSTLEVRTRHYTGSPRRPHSCAERSDEIGW